MLVQDLERRIQRQQVSTVRRKEDRVDPTKFIARPAKFTPLSLSSSSSSSSSSFSAGEHSFGFSDSLPLRRRRHRSRCRHRDVDLLLPVDGLGRHHGK
jgi:hypothetical protein